MVHERERDYSGGCHRLAGQTAIVTGAAGGIGTAIALRLAGEGAQLALFDRNAKGSEAVAGRIRDGGGSADVHELDVAVRSDVETALSAVLQEWGQVDILVNNAGIGIAAPFLSMTDADWNKVFRVNVAGCFVVGQEVARAMAQKGSGKIVNVASLAAHTANSNQSAYAASKGAVAALTRAMAFELAPLGISVNAVSPGPVDTPMAKSMLTPETRLAREMRIPQGRLGYPEEIAATIAFLVSGDAGYVNGTVLIVDGGLLTAGVRQ